MELKVRNVPCIGPKDCRIARRCKVFLGTEFGRWAMVQEDLFGWPPMERKRDFEAANMQAESSRPYGQCIESTTIWLGTYRGVSKGLEVKGLSDATAPASSR